jgi:hypothetical protein
MRDQHGYSIAIDIVIAIDIDIYPGSVIRFCYDINIVVVIVIAWAFGVMVLW